MTVVLSTVYSNSTFANTSKSIEQQDSVQTIHVKVKGVTCSSDLKTISQNVEKANGVKSCTTGKEGATTIFIIEFDALKISEKEIYAVIEGTGGCENPNERPYKVKQ
jgi:copper chaperone CopZ